MTARGWIDPKVLDHLRSTTDSQATTVQKQTPVLSATVCAQRLCRSTLSAKADPSGGPEMASSLAIQLDDGRVVVGTPKPEDQGRLGDLALGDEIELSGSDLDTSGHAMAEDVLVDVEGHAMTLRLPTAGRCRGAAQGFGHRRRYGHARRRRRDRRDAGQPGHGGSAAVHHDAGTRSGARGRFPDPQGAGSRQDARSAGADPSAGRHDDRAAGSHRTRCRRRKLALARAPQTITAPARGPAPAADFQTRKQQQADEMLDAPRASR